MVDAAIAAIAEATGVTGTVARLQGVVGDRAAATRSATSSSSSRSTATRRRAVASPPTSSRPRPGRTSTRSTSWSACATRPAAGTDGRAMTVNLWSEAEHARDYLARRKRPPAPRRRLRRAARVPARRPGRVLDLGTGDGELLALSATRTPPSTGVAVGLLGRDARAGASPLRRRRAVDGRRAQPRRPAPRVVGRPSTPSCPRSRSTTSTTPASAPSTARSTTGSPPAGCSATSSTSPRRPRELHEAFLVALGAPPSRTTRRTSCRRRRAQLAWLRELGFEQVDCHWKWRELALLFGRKPDASAGEFPGRADPATDSVGGRDCRERRAADPRHEHHEAVRRLRRGRGHRLRDRTGRGVRIPRSERRGQDLDDADDRLRLAPLRRRAASPRARSRDTTDPPSAPGSASCPKRTTSTPS